MDNKIRLGIGALAVSATALVSIALNEGYRGEAYKDAVGVPTVGYGETKGVTMKSKTTPDRALVQLLSSANQHADDIRQCIKVPLHQHEFDAYVSLAYNIGAKNFCHSTLVRKLNAKDYKGACTEIRRWDKAGGKVLRGLTVRRQREYLTCVGGQA
ncbi:lysozyme [Oxalobacter formigenes]